jgi:hypothetical protein
MLALYLFLQVVFEVGVLLYEMFTGQHPVPDYPLVLAYAPDTVPPITPGTPGAGPASHPALPAEFVALCPRMVHPDPTQRPGLSEVARTLSALAQRANPVVRGPGPEPEPVVMPPVLERVVNAQHLPPPSAHQEDGGKVEDDGEEPMGDDDWGDFVVEEVEEPVKRAAATAHAAGGAHAAGTGAPGRMVVDEDAPFSSRPPPEAEGGAEDPQAGNASGGARSPSKRVPQAQPPPTGIRAQVKSMSLAALRQECTRSCARCVGTQSRSRFVLTCVIRTPHWKDSIRCVCVHGTSIKLWCS